MSPESVVAAVGIQSWTLLTPCAHIPGLPAPCHTLVLPCMGIKRAQVSRSQPCVHTQPVAPRGTLHGPIWNPAGAEVQRRRLSPHITPPFLLVWGIPSAQFSPGPL